MAEQPTALRLADQLDSPDTLCTAPDILGAAAELRRLSEENEALRTALLGLVRNEGLEAFSNLDRGIGAKTASGQRWLKAREIALKGIIAKAEGEQK